MFYVNQLQSISWTLSTLNQRTNITLQNLPAKVPTGWGHVVKFLFGVTVTPTYSSGTGTVLGTMNTVTNLDFFDGQISRFVGGFNQLRIREKLHTGRLRQPDPDTDTASATARYYHRTLHMGPPNFLGQPSDFAVPSGMLSGAELRFTSGTLTDIGANCTAATVTITISAVMIGLPEIRIPPAYQWSSITATANDLIIPGRALLESLSLADSSALGAITAGDFGNFTVDLGAGPYIGGVSGRDLRGIYWDEYAPGEIGVFQGEPAAASDDDGKAVDHTSPTAIAAAASDLQVIAFAQARAKITKLPVCEQNVRLKWSGSQTTGEVYLGRILSQPQSVIENYLAKACQGIGRSPKSMKVKTLSKRPFPKGHPYTEFMPWKVEV